jgi:putative heme-binding domain-containing protein
LQAEQPADVRAAAARALGTIGDPALARLALARWVGYPLDTRREVVLALARSPALSAVAVEALEQGQLAATDLPPDARDVMRRLPDAALRRRAEKLLPRPAGDRAQLFRRYQEALRLPGDARRGAEVFARHCLTCHALPGRGGSVGPDVAGAASRPAAALLEDVLDPNKEVAPNYLSHVLITTRGQVLTGLVANETAASVTLRQAGGVEDVVTRREIQELRSTGRSLMPEGLEDVIPPADMADLLRYLRAPIPLPSERP